MCDNCLKNVDILQSGLLHECLNLIVLLYIAQGAWKQLTAVLDQRWAVPPSSDRTVVPLHACIEASDEQVQMSIKNKAVVGKVKV